MITFKQYFFIQENISTYIDEEGNTKFIHSSNLLLNNTGKLPDSKPYGFWTDRSGNYASVDAQGHASMAGNIISASIKFKDANGGMTDEEEALLKKSLTSKGEDTGVYKVLFDAGFMHVVLNGSRTVYFYKTATGAPTLGQKKFLNNLSDTYGTSTEYASEIF